VQQLLGDASLFFRFFCMLLKCCSYWMHMDSVMLGLFNWQDHFKICRDERMDCNVMIILQK